jgi:psiF repeat
MLRCAVTAVLVVMLPGAPSYAVTSKDKMSICKFGADDQKLTGPARSKFIKKCMSETDEPRGPGPQH